MAATEANPAGRGPLPTILAVERSRVRLLGLLGVAILVTALGVVLGLGALDVGLIERAIGWLCAVFFLACTALIARQLFSLPKVVVTLTPNGLRDVRMAPEAIPWPAIQGIDLYSMSGSTFIILAVDPAVEAALTLSRNQRWSRGTNRRMGFDGLHISTQGLKMSAVDLAGAIAAFRQAHAGPL